MNVRSATIEDAAAMAHVRVHAWQQAYRGILPDDLLDNMDEAVITKRWRTIVLAQPSPGVCNLVAEDETGLVIGFAAGGPERNADPEYPGEVYALYVLPGSQRRGAGKALVSAGVNFLLAQGWQELLIWVLEQNRSGRSFYEKLGGRPVRKKQVEIGNVLYPEIGYGWKDVSQLICKNGSF
jgi:ribosomal protein S18 acetylase RimI-like enzyme